MIKGLTPALESAFVSGLPSLACVSNNFKDDGIERRTKRNAITYKNIQYNPAAMVRAFCYDVDTKNGLYQWSDNNCLAPNWISVNASNGHAHYGYFIKAPVSRTFKSRPKPQQFANAVNKGMTAKLGADRAYAGFMTKNPLHEDWITYTVETNIYDLNDLADDVHLVWKADKREEAESGELGRNCTLFEQVRYWAYKNVQRYRSVGGKDSFLNAVRATADTYNSQFDNPLTEPELKSVSKSVGNWTYKNYRGDGKNRGVMELQSKAHGLTDTDRRSLGAAYSASVKRSATEQKIKEAVAYLQSSNQRVSIRSIATFIGCSTRTIQNHKHLLKV